MIKKIISKAMKNLLTPPLCRAASIMGVEKKNGSEIKKRKSIRKIGILLALALALHSLNTFAIPVEDFGAYIHMAQELSQLEKEYQVLQDAYKNAQDQLNQQKQLVSNSQGHYGFGALQNGAGDLRNREWSPNTWDAALQGLSGGNSDRYQQLLSEYKNNHPSLSPQEFEKGASESVSQMYQLQIKTNQAASVNATYAFNDIEQLLKNVQDLSSQIEKSQNTKASMDLNARMVAEVAYIQIQELKMQALINEQLAQQSADQINGETQSAKFNRLPDNP